MTCVPPVDRPSMACSSSSRLGHRADRDARLFLQRHYVTGFSAGAIKA
jgi:hypothetical protein